MSSERGVQQRRTALRGRRGALELTVLAVEATVLVVLTDERLHDADAGHVLLEHLVQTVEAGQHRAVERRAVRW